MLNARTIFILMVMFAFITTVCTKKNDYVIMLKTHSKRALHINGGGKVTAADISLAQNFTMDSVRDIEDLLSGTLKITLFVKEVGRYLCFRRGRLVGLKTLTSDCHFKESMKHGYYLYANAYNQTLRVGFTKGFKPVNPKHLKRPQALRKSCFLFEKIKAEDFDRELFTTSTATTQKPATTSTSSTRTTTVTTISTTKSSLAITRNQKLSDKKEIEIKSITNSNNKHNSSNDVANTHKPKEYKSVDLPEARLGENKNGSIDGNKSSQKQGNHQNRVYHPQRHARRRKLQRKPMMATRHPQPKNLVRHHNNNKIFERRIRNEREQKVRKSRRKCRQQYRQRERAGKEQIENNRELPTSSSASSSTATVATALTATATIAPSALNIVAVAMAASCRKRGRRKKDIATATTSANGTDMDMQIVAQKTPLSSPSTLKSTATSGERFYDQMKSHIYQHEHNYLQQQSTVNSHAFGESETQQQRQQQNEYSNSNLISNLNSNAIPASPKNYLYDTVTTKVDLNKHSRSTDYSSNLKFSSHQQQQQQQEPQNQPSGRSYRHSNTFSSSRAYLNRSKRVKRKGVDKQQEHNEDADEPFTDDEHAIESSSKATFYNNNVSDKDNADNNFKQKLLTYIYRKRFQRNIVKNNNNNYIDIIDRQHRNNHHRHRHGYHNKRYSHRHKRSYSQIDVNGLNQKNYSVNYIDNVKIQRHKADFFTNDDEIDKAAANSAADRSRTLVSFNSNVKENELINNFNENLLAAYRKRFFGRLTSNDNANNDHQENFNVNEDDRSVELRMNNKYEEIIVQYKYVVFTFHESDDLILDCSQKKSK